MSGYLMVATGLALRLTLALTLMLAAAATATAAATTTLHGGGGGGTDGGGRGASSGRGMVTRTCCQRRRCGVHFLSGIEELIGHGGCSVNSNTGTDSPSMEMAATWRQAVS